MYYSLLKVKTRECETRKRDVDLEKTKMFAKLMDPGKR